MARTTDPDIHLLQAAADPIRLRMLRQLSLGPVCACDFTADSKVSQPTVSHHLRVLRDAGWVSTERRGTWIWYSISPDAVERLRALGAGLDPDPALAGQLRGRGVRLPVIEANAQ
jgi:ArsR family transcriptional regulator